MRLHHLSPGKEYGIVILQDNVKQYLVSGIKTCSNGEMHATLNTFMGRQSLPRRRGDRG